ncbi:hypothetical protein [Nonomuraea gerenzanensis]|uniref:Uncharacterized protein n=1 Tax=Nonomuraea gerenzanensis TaxID=93944 RepID=A0A1M4BL83_9ACTN|nr:hypothetical protein [Nonomuraea gerenzanensis]UBU10019.1 hypothetical protein LCN96_37460 [Nonomuraea gerenzanensis]SAP16272.1 hypothetical protein BN4615_P10935 [Nonomuraea gerenzanensis]
MVVELLALVAFLASAIWAGIQRAWPVCLLAVGAFLLVLAGTGLIDG